MSIKYGGSNSLTKLLQLIKSGFSAIGHTHTVLGDSTTKTVTVNANGVSECSSTASGINSHAEGYNSTASGRNSHAEGAANTASGVNAHAEGGSTTASDTNAHAEGAYTKATKPASHAEGDSSEAIASNAHAEGYHAKASGDNSHAEGSYTIASTSNSHAEGGGTQASGAQSHAEGAGTQASGAQSHAEGGSAKATGPQSHAEGGSTTASGINAHAEGGTTTASGVNAHSEGVFSNATASAAHAEGDHANAYHDNSHAEGSYTETGCANQHVAGKYNVVTSGMAEVIGNGTGANARSNARTLDWDGNAWFAGEVSATEELTDVDTGTVTSVTHNLTEKADRTGYTWGQAKGRFTWGSVRGLPSVDDSTTTTNLGLTKPGYGSTLDIETLNDNMDILDEAAAGYIDGELTYPTFIRTGWSESSDESTLPTTPCVVIDTSKPALYFCGGE